MKIVIAILFVGMALLSGCATQTLPPQPVFVPEQPLPSSNSVTSPNPEIKLEPQLHITDSKIIVLDGDAAGVEFNTNVPATSKVKLITGEKDIANQEISEKQTYHYYKFSNLKQLTLYYVVIESQSDSYDKTTLTFTTSGVYLAEPTYPSNYFAPFYYYYIPPYVPPTVPTTYVFWSGTTTVYIEP